MSTARIIRKYPNRRLYDTEDSRYITLADVQALVLEKVEFVILDKKTGDDITRAILLQVISEKEQQGAAIMSQPFLSQVIRSYDAVVPDLLSHYLEQSLTRFLDQHRSEPSGPAGAPASTESPDAAGVNFARLKSLQDDARRRAGGALETRKIEQTRLSAQQKKAS
jgi:polyhydroxyalkanoate synthesis repressor PhaR